MVRKIVLAGGSGYLGTVLANYFSATATEIIVLSRKEGISKDKIRFVHWDGSTVGDWSKQLEGCDLLVNLSGKNVNCRYTEKNKKEIFRSRLEPTEVLGTAIASLEQPPKVWINLASATIYRHAEDRPQDEESGEIGSGFSVEVCKAWETVFLGQSTPGTKKIILRTGIVIGEKDEVSTRLIRLVRFGLGGTIGRGNQRVSWIHELDFARIVEWAFEHGKERGVYNATAPGIISNRQLMQLYREACGIRLGLPTPRWMLEIGAFIIGTETELVLKSRWVYPQLLLSSGFQFTYSEARPAIQDLVSRRRFSVGE